MSELEHESNAILTRFGRNLSEELGTWAESRDDRARTRFRLLRGGFRREVAPKRSSGWLWAPLGFAAAAVALFLAVPRALTYTVSGEAANAGVLNVNLTAHQALRFSDGSELLVHPGTRAVIADVTPNGARVELLQGALDASIQHRPKAAWSVSAGPFTVAVIGTRFSVRWDEKQAALLVNLHEGSVRVTGRCISDRQLTVGQTLNVSCNQAKGSGALAAVGNEERTLPAPAPALPPVSTQAALEPRAAHPSVAMRKTAPLSDDSLRRELQAIAEVRRELEHNPAHALALADESRAQFPGGALAEEREALALFALDKLGRSQEVRARGQRFLVKFPGGPFSAKVRGILKHAASFP